MKNAPRARRSVQARNRHYRITKVDWPAGAATGDLTLLHDTWLLPMTSGHLRMVGPQDEQALTLIGGQGHRMEAGGEWDLINVSENDVSAILIELRDNV